MFKKILVANRGEIALRVIFACRELGIKTVAVYSEADENSLHVRFADEDICIGGARSSESYLNVPAIISAAEITGADAIHPGYGFLSESAYLAEVCEACHIRFIGPDPNVIRLLGDKAKARRAMKKAGLPMLPGSDGPVENEDRALQLAKDIGYPVIVKAVAGGGGRGMRIVKAAGELAHALRTAQREAEAAFGNGDVYIERYLESPRHIEFQILGDHHGAVVHLGERECSIQRRHQKLLEESPSPVITDKVRRKMGALVADAAQAVQYTNAGTFEFLMDDKGHFYFMEVNTRVQVEHPVTEFVTGFDIVKEQIRIAAGERLSFRQSDVTFTGHALECRINAEDPETFVPSPGVIHAFAIPGGPGVRVDTAAHPECTITPYYDSMIAKVIVHGRDRAESIARMKRVLGMTVIEGIKTSIPLHLKILNDADFVAGRMSTHFMERFAPPARPRPRRWPSPPEHRPGRGRPDPAPLRHRRRRGVHSRRARAAGRGRGVHRCRRPPAPGARQDAGRRRAAGAGRRRDRTGPRRRRGGRGQRPRRRRRGGRGRRARRPVGPAGRGRASAARSVRARRLLDAHARRTGAGAGRADQLRRLSVRCSQRRPRPMPIRSSGSTACAPLHDVRRRRACPWSPSAVSRWRRPRPWSPPAPTPWR